LAIFHHNPDHTDKMMAEIEAEAKKVWAGTIVAREEMALIL
jgi:phosphoribosyl 1,2-cyclic phosphodiesterase